ncbi:MAG: IS5 family transposase [Deltaproteobacteria bacterium]|nr:IS5 family transposase [Deltaproteobacteria bacterium]
MGFKNMKTNLTFADISIFNSLEKNRAIQRMEDINRTVDWSRIETLLLRNYPVGKSFEGNSAYPPLFLMKCLLLQQWFKIDSDPELETQINDRNSFKKFLGLSFDDVAPDHSTFSRFRGRFSKDTMRMVNHELLSQFTAKGLTINEGIAIDARLVQSASHPLSNQRLQEEKLKQQTPEGKVDKNGKALKFSRDLESDWTVKNDVAHFGLKEHASVDTRYGFVLSTEMTPASRHDSPYLPLCVAGSCHTQEPIKKVFADKGYFGKPNREFLALNKIEDGIMRKATTGTELTEYETERNKAISKVRYIVEQYFGLSHLHNNAFRARFPRMIKNAIDVLFRQMAFNLARASKILKPA